MSQTRENLLDGYLRPLLDKYFPNQHIEIERCFDTLDVFIAFGNQRRRITYEQMRDRDSNKILDIAYKIANPHRYPREATDYFDGRLHGPKTGDLSPRTYEIFDGEKWIKTHSPLAERVDRAALKYAQALCLECLGKQPNSVAEFEELKNVCEEITKLEERCK